MEPTEDDARVARLATALLVDRGHPDLSVSPLQLVRWRKVDAIPVAGSRRGGRGQRARYLPTAPAAAAELALALDVDRNLDRAILGAFGAGAPIPAEGVRAAAEHCFREMENVARRSRGHQAFRRSDIPRRHRVPVAGTRTADASLQSDAVLSLLMDEVPLSGDTGPSFALDAVAPEVPELLSRDTMRRFEFVVKRLSLAAIRRYVRIVSVDRWQEACGWMGDVLDYAQAASALD